MRIPLVIILLLIIAGSIIVFTHPNIPNLPSKITRINNVSPSKVDFPQTSIIAQGLDTPWSIVFLPDGSMLVTERPGRVRLVNPEGKLDPTPVVTLGQVKEFGEGGLLGIEKDPDFRLNNYIYLYYTYSSNGSNTLNRVSRFTYKDRTIKDEKVLVDGIPGSLYHDGGRIKFGPDGYLYITTGDAQNPSQAQNKNSLAGKILRVTKDGSAAPGNPLHNSVYSYGHRNPQGITWVDKSRMYETEHGPSGGQYGFGNDEFNYIEAGKNYGWPIIIGNQTKIGLESPFMNSGSDTWAPGGIAYYKYDNDNSSVFFGGLKGQALYEVKFIGDNRTFLTHFKNEFGRIRDVVLGPDNMLYITTSNEDGRGVSSSIGDKIIRVNPTKL